MIADSLPSIKAWLAGGLFLTASICVFAQDAVVASQLPAIKSSKTAESLLQDVTRVGSRLVAVGERGHIIFSDDNGKTWQQADVPTRAMLNAVFFIGNDEGWAVGHDGLVLHSTDGGKSWSIQLDGLKFTRKRMADKIPVLEAKLKQLNDDKAAAEAHIADIEQGADGGEGNSEDTQSKYEDVVAELDDGISTAEDELKDAKAALSNTVASPLMDVWFRDPSTGFAVGAFGEFLKTEDGGTTWVSVADRLDNEEHNHLNAITGSGDVVYIAGEAGHIYRSTDGGQRWTQLESPDPENGSFFAISIISGDQIFVSGLRGAMYRSSDKGSTWKSIAEDLHKNMNNIYVAGNDTVLAVGNDGAFLRSRDSGRTFLPHVRKNRLTITSVTEAENGDYVLVGAGGVYVISPENL